MTDTQKNALLPTGLRDVLPDDAAFEAAVVEQLMAVFAMHGYERVKPPLIEFEESLLTGAGAALANQTFRLMDPVSQRMMGVRADITPQIARIARSRLAGDTRPLRLSYTGDVLRVRGSQLRPQRQLVQAGAELIGSAAPEADAEIIVLALKAIGSAGVDALSVDLTIPRLVPALFDQNGIAGDEAAAIRDALDRKDSSAVASLGGAAAAGLELLVDATGPAQKSLDKLMKSGMSDELTEHVARVARIADILRARVPDAQLTLDPVEHRGFEYHTGVGFTVFARAEGGELASGGRYRVRGGDDESGERATGVTLYVDSILRALQPAFDQRHVLVPGDLPEAQIDALQADGWVTIAALAPAKFNADWAKQLRCSHILEGGAAKPVKGTGTE